jgi:hypothetical protein
MVSPWLHLGLIPAEEEKRKYIKKFKNLTEIRGFGVCETEDGRQGPDQSKCLVQKQQVN